ncbi:MAG TPA: GDSL-type esterase/lipase family protein, partial [Vicinamibacterales bacterium]|nr:GDSL-type esterase/lipase family protein [Vicinamibacterales bacterium]
VSVDRQPPAVGSARSTKRGMLTSAMLLAAINIGVLVALLVPVELVFGNWVRPMRLSDLKRFSIPIGVTFEADVSALYSGSPRNPAKYTRDQYGLRGTYASLSQIDVLTVGGSTTDQRFLDDTATWQAVAQRELEKMGHPLVIANAGVDGQSTVGAAFNFQNWFPLLDGLKPSVYLFYMGTNDVLRRQDRLSFDESVDARSWRVRSVTYQLYRTIRGNLQAHDASVTHGRRPNLTAADFTAAGLLSPQDRDQLASQIARDFVANCDKLRQSAVAAGGLPIFVTQTAFAWNADKQPPRGVSGTIVAHGRTMNFADIAVIHQSLNRGLIDFCTQHGLTCFDMPNEVAFDGDDYYDYLHNTPKGAEKIGRYLAAKLATLQLPNRSATQ